jgi:hypothetical protein
MPFSRHSMTLSQALELAHLPFFAD